MGIVKSCGEAAPNFLGQNAFELIQEYCTTKEPGEKHRLEPYFNFGGRKFFNHKTVSKFEGQPNINNPEMNPVEIRPDINVGKKPEDEITPKEFEEPIPREGLEQEKKELSPEEKITNIIGQINSVDERMFSTRKSAAQDEAKLKTLLESMGLTSNSETSPGTDFNNDRIASLEAEKAELAKEREEWIEEFGRDNLPEGLALEESEDGREAKGVSPEKELELTDKEKQEQTKERRGWLEAWKKDAVVNFEKGMRNDWRTKDAINLDLTIEVMKLRVPNAMEKEMKDFVEGKTDEPPSVVWIHWKCNSSLDQVLGKPNMITSLDITFDNEVVKIADTEDLEKKDEKTEESKSEVKPGETLLDDKKPTANSPESRTAERPKA